MKKTKSGVEEGKGGGSPSRPIDARIQELRDWRGEMLARIRMLIKQAEPEVEILSSLVFQEKGNQAASCNTPSTNTLPWRRKASCC